MTHYYQDDFVTLYHGDCREIVPTLGRFDLLLTDPPYGVLPEAWDKFSEQGFNVFNARWMSLAAELVDRAVVFSGSSRSNIPNMLDMMYRNIRRMVWDKGTSATADGAFWFCYEEFYICSNQKQTEFVPPKMMGVAKAIKKARTAAGMSRGAVDMAVRGKKTGLCYRWEEGCCLPTDEQEAVLQDILDIYSYGYADEIKKARSERDNTVDAMRRHNAENGARYSDVLRFPVKKESDHPCEKPVGLIITILEGVGGTTILDPFAGSGTTGRAAKDLGRKAVLIEREERYCEIAAKRMLQEVFDFGASCGTVGGDGNSSDTPTGNAFLDL